MQSADNPAPSRRQLGLWDTVLLIVGIIVGVGIFKTPGIVFSAAGHPWLALSLWVGGGVLTLLGALCFAELAAAYPRSGGEYVYLTRAFGPPAGFLFAWAQLAVIRAGAIGQLAYIFAQFAGQGFGYAREAPLRNCLVASAVIALLTGVNLLGVRMGKTTQNVLTLLKILGIGAIFIAGGLLFVQRLGEPAKPVVATLVGIDQRPGESVKRVTLRTEQGEIVSHAISAETIPPPVEQGRRVTVYVDEAGRIVEMYVLPSVSLGGIALGLILVLWTYSGWHEAAYVVSEIRDERRTIPLALMLGTSTVILLYALINLAYYLGLGFDRAANASEIAFDLLHRLDAGLGGQVMAVLVMLSCLGALNGMVFTSSRIYAEMGRDHPLFRPLGRWSSRWQTPVTSLLVQGGLSVLFVLFVGLYFQGEDGFQALVVATAAVFWLFFFLTGVSLFVLRWKEPEIDRPFRVPVYPLVPLLFCLASFGMIVASVRYDWFKSVLGAAILLAGLPLYAFSQWLRQE